MEDGTSYLDDMDQLTVIYSSEKPVGTAAEPSSEPATQLLATTLPSMLLVVAIGAERSEIAQPLTPYSLVGQVVHVGGARAARAEPVVAFEPFGSLRFPFGRAQICPVAVPPSVSPSRLDWVG